MVIFQKVSESICGAMYFPSTCALDTYVGHEKEGIWIPRKISDPRDKVNFRHPKLSNQALHIAGK